jgi:hypothetical protein
MARPYSSAGYHCDVVLVTKNFAVLLVKQLKVEHSGRPIEDGRRLHRKELQHRVGGANTVKRAGGDVDSFARVHHVFDRIDHDRAGSLENVEHRVGPIVAVDLRRHVRIECHHVSPDNMFE